VQFFVGLIEERGESGHVGSVQTNDPETQLSAEGGRRTGEPDNSGRKVLFHEASPFHPPQKSKPESGWCNQVNCTTPPLPSPGYRPGFSPNCCSINPTTSCTELSGPKLITDPIINSGMVASRIRR
jgi:hypothetical protein